MRHSLEASRIAHHLRRTTALACCIITPGIFASTHRLPHLRRFTSVPTGYPGLPPWANFYRAYGARIFFVPKCASRFDFRVFVLRSLRASVTPSPNSSNSSKRTPGRSPSRRWCSSSFFCAGSAAAFATAGYHARLRRRHGHEPPPAHVQPARKALRQTGNQRDPAPTIRWIDLNDRSN